jgi:FkbM family methyltransferase
MNSLLRLVRRLATMPGLRRLTTIDVVTRVSFSLRASLVRERWRFARNELRPGRPQTAVYRLSGSGVAITIRHRSPDVLILDELFSQEEYRFPEAVWSRLAESRDRRLRVADLGANIGLFGAWILGHFPQAEIVAVEPDPENAKVHRRTIEANGRTAEWRLVEAGAATEQATLRFAPGSFTLSHAAPAGEGIEVEAVDVFPLIADAELVKIDIEGAEWPILRDRRFSQLEAAAVVLEYHPAGSPGTEPAFDAAQTLLERAGFTIVSHHPKGEGVGVLWALGPSP